jgi:hypothetical protein
MDFSDAGEGCILQKAAIGVVLWGDLEQAICCQFQNIAQFSRSGD